ncbi:glycosyltransferase [Streptomyces sp. NPDC101219]|uniref:glycosyltransferase n=1 Tax=Streptomyces sp. NPDC101219 TaxID=3366131 RepID=UPI0037F69527
MSRLYAVVRGALPEAPENGGRRPPPPPPVPVPAGQGSLPPSAVNPEGAAGVRGRVPTDGRSRWSRPGPAALTALVLLPVSVALWLWSLQGVRLDGMGDLGLLQVLPVLFWAALALLVLGFCLAAAGRRTPHGCYAAYSLTLIAFLHATPPVLYQELRYSWAWKHVAVIDAMMRHNGAVPEAGGFDIYNQWPGFFELNASLLKATGLESSLAYALWAQVLANVLLLVPLLLIYRSVTADRRLIWTGVWIYYSCSWVGQDYFAPQAFTFLLFACVIALVVRQLPGSRAPGAPPRGRLSRGRLALVLVIEAAIVSSHQLTPLMLISALALLSVPRRNRPVTLPALGGAAALTVIWDATVARPYVAENLDSFLHALTRPEANVWSGLSRLADAAPSQVMVSWIDRGLSGGILLLAAVALKARPWTRRTALPWLALFPLPLMLVNAYGGEMVFRAYMFALPSAALLVAALLLPSPGRRRVLRTAGLYVLLVAMVVSLTFGYYTKEAMNRFSSDEVAATRFVTTRTPTGTMVISVTFAAPGLETDYDRHERTEITEESMGIKRLMLQNPLTGLEPLLGRAENKPAYVLINRAQTADLRLNGELPAGFVRRLETAMATAPDFTLVFRNDDAVVYRFDAPRETRQP